MIAVAVRDSNAKITTPNEAATSRGVSPISSRRNVMVKVKDTLSFIEAAIAVHGDRYDYSQTEFKSSDGPIVIVCRKCGPFTLAQTYSHYRKNKPCGCRSCSIEKRLIRNGNIRNCHACGAWNKRQNLANPEFCKECNTSSIGQWFKWAKKEFNHMCLIARKKDKRTDWEKWAELKRVSFCPSRARRKPSGRVAKHVEYTSWIEWSIARNGLVKTRETDKWKIKAKNMADNLLRHARVERKQKTF